VAAGAELDSMIFHGLNWTNGHSREKRLSVN
jgi:hypothetical protein